MNFFAYNIFIDHPWTKEDGEAPDKPIDNAVLGRLKQFRAMNQFKKVALRVILLLHNLNVSFNADTPLL